MSLCLLDIGPWIVCLPSAARACCASVFNACLLQACKGLGWLVLGTVAHVLLAVAVVCQQEARDALFPKVR